MKHRTLCTRSQEALSAILLLIGMGMQSMAEPSLPPQGNERQAPGSPEAVAEAPAADTDAPAQLASEAKPLPAQINPSSAVAEVIKLANSGVDQSVMLAFVTNSTRTFNLGAEEIIYLNDIGVPGPVVTAMIQRDEALKTMLATAAGGPPAALPTVPDTTVPPSTQMSATAPPPEQVAPQPGEGGQPYAVEAPLTPPDEGADSMFYDSLSPYGNWVDVAGYGRCWQPTVVVANPYWQPYYNCGHWVYSDCGWYWYSTYTWGWAPFHYGCWFRHAHLGWCWAPGRVWAPSWVCWRYNDHYCGWAPLPPGASFTAGVGVTFHGRYVGEREDFGLRPDHYHFVAWDHFHDRQLPPSGLSSNQRERVFATSTVSTRITGDNQTVINNGLPVSRVAAATHQPIHTVALREASAPLTAGGRLEQLQSGGSVLSVYRPSPGQGQAPGPFRTSSPGTPRPSSGSRRSSNDTPKQTGSLVFRGSQPAALQETPPPHSLVVIGQRTPSQPMSPSAPSARPAARAEEADSASAAVTRAPNAVNRPAAVQVPQRSWMGTVSSSPQPSWFAGSDSQVQNRFNGAVAAPRPEMRTYQTVPRTSSPEVQRYAPSSTYTAQRSYSAPAPQVPMRAPSYEPPRSAPSAPPAPSASHSSSSQSSNRGSGR